MGKEATLKKGRLFFFPNGEYSVTIRLINIDGLVKSLKMRYSVIPVKTGIQSFQYLGRFWIPACAGMTTFYEFINIDPGPPIILSPSDGGGRGWG
jgi:hypothetical protein